jgi:uncharacterized membrane protein YkvA (DUF1232 family)
LTDPFVPTWILISLLALLTLWALLVAALMLAGRRADARALAGFIPDCLVFVKRLLAGPEVPRRRKAALVLLVAYLASPIDLVPDFLPGIGQLDDALAVALVLRYVFRGGGRGLLRERWPGPDSSRALIERVAFG